MLLKTIKWILYILLMILAIELIRISIYLNQVNQKFLGNLSLLSLQL